MVYVTLTVGRPHRRQREEAVAPLAEPGDPLVHVKEPREGVDHGGLHAQELAREMPGEKKSPFSRILNFPPSRGKIPGDAAVRSTSRQSTQRRCSERSRTVQNEKSSR